LHGEVVAIEQLQDVVKESVFLIPQTHTVMATMAHGVRNLDEVFPELAGHVLVSGFLLSQFHRAGEQVQGVHRHPASAIRLFDVSAGGQRSATVERSDIVQAKKSSLENVHSFSNSTHPPPG